MISSWASTSQQPHKVDHPGRNRSRPIIVAVTDDRPDERTIEQSVSFTRRDIGMWACSRTSASSAACRRQLVTLRAKGGIVGAPTAAGTHLAGSDDRPTTGVPVQTHQSKNARPGSPLRSRQARADRAGADR